MLAADGAVNTTHVGAFSAPVRLQVARVQLDMLHQQLLYIILALWSDGVRNVATEMSGQALVAIDDGTLQTFDIACVKAVEPQTGHTKGLVIVSDVRMINTCSVLLRDPTDQLSPYLRHPRSALWRRRTSWNECEPLSYYWGLSYGVLASILVDNRPETESLLLQLASPSHSVQGAEEDIRLDYEARTRGTGVRQYCSWWTSGFIISRMLSLEIRRKQYQSSNVDESRPSLDPQVGASNPTPSCNVGAVHGDSAFACECEAKLISDLAPRI